MKSFIPTFLWHYHALLLTFTVSLCLRNPECRYLASSSKDASVRIWDTVLGRCDKILTGHTQSVTCVKWGGDGLLYTSSQDRTVKVWRAKDVRANVLSESMSVYICLLDLQHFSTYLCHEIRNLRNLLCARYSNRKFLIPNVTFADLNKEVFFCFFFIILIISVCFRGFSVGHCRVMLTGWTHWPSAPTTSSVQEPLSQPRLQSTPRTLLAHVRLITLVINF